jgi:hypothetical protein
MKTAMQELLSEMSYPNWDKLSFDARYQIFDILLKKEKEQIINAHGLRYSDITKETVNGEQYYNKTFNQEPKKEYGPSKKYLKKQKELIEDFVWNKINKNNQNK